MNDIAIFYTARRSSTRLSDKMLRKMQGKTVLEHGLLRLLFNKNIKIYLCTTYLSDDDPLVDVAKKLGVQAYRGDVNDVLSRYLGAARQFGVKFFVAVDGDDLFVENYYIKKIINTYKATDADAVFYEGLPFGTGANGIKTDALEKLILKKDDSDTEGWGRYFLKTKIFKVKKIKALPKHNFPEYRLTLDYKEDWDLIKRIYAKLYKPKKYFNLDKVLKYLKDNPKTARINWRRKDEYAKRFKKKYSIVNLKK